MGGLSPNFNDCYPQEFSGGQLQLIGVAHALSLKPKLIVLDEAISPLDVSIQAQILNLLADIRAATGISYVVISHDLGVVRQITDSTIVMQRGVAVERGTTADVLHRPQHPYTQLLRRSVPAPGWKPARRARPAPAPEPRA